MFEFIKKNWRVILVTLLIAAVLLSPPLGLIAWATTWLGSPVAVGVVGMFLFTSLALVLKGFTFMNRNSFYKSTLKKALSSGSLDSSGSEDEHAAPPNSPLSETADAKSTVPPRFTSNNHQRDSYEDLLSHPGLPPLDISRAQRKSSTPHDSSDSSLSSRGRKDSPPTDDSSPYKRRHHVTPVSPVAEAKDREHDDDEAQGHEPPSTLYKK